MEALGLLKTFLFFFSVQAMDLIYGHLTQKMEYVSRNYIHLTPLKQLLRNLLLEDLYRYYVCHHVSKMR
jgi:hypothetical protein